MERKQEHSPLAPRASLGRLSLHSKSNFINYKPLTSQCRGRVVSMVRYCFTARASGPTHSTLVHTL